MKLLFSFLLALSLVSATSYILASGTTVTYTMELDRNPNNSSNMDLTLGLTYTVSPFAATGTSVNSIVCIDTAVANFSLTSATGLSIMAAKWTCDAGCAAVTALDTSFEVRGGSNANYSSNEFNSGGVLTALSGVTFTERANLTTNTNNQVASGLTPANLAAGGLPNASQTFYYRCFAQGNSATAIDYTAALDTIITTHATSTANVTVVGGAYGIAVGVSAFAALASFVF